MYVNYLYDTYFHAECKDMLNVFKEKNDQKICIYREEESSALNSTKIGKACGPDNRICLCSKVVKSCKEQLVTPTKAMRLFQVSFDKWVCHPFTVNVIS